MGKAPLFTKKSSAPASASPAGDPTDLSALAGPDSGSRDGPTDADSSGDVVCPKCGCEFDPATGDIAQAGQGEKSSSDGDADDLGAALQAIVSQGHPGLGSKL